MGRHRKKVVVEDEEYEWPFKICIELKRNHWPKIAFMSGCPREYFPDDPGFSKFGITHCFADPDDTTDCQYSPPSSVLIRKQTSNVGYGIGGLLGPRFANDKNLNVPAPNEYQQEITPALVKGGVKEKRMSWREFVEKYEKIVVDQYTKYEAELEDAKNQELKSRGKRYPHKQQTPDVEHKSHSIKTGSSQLTIPCIPKSSAFGLSLKVSRFGHQDRDSIGLPGLYEPKTLVQKSYQITTPEGQLVPRVRTVCSPGKYDVCKVCKKELIQADYYQTRLKIKVVDHDPLTESKSKMEYQSLCRECYCTALQHGVEPWHKKSIPRVFIKARHCNSVHDHKEGMTEFVAKATCKRILNLSRRELIYSRYFKDEPCQRHHKAR